MIRLAILCLAVFCLAFSGCMERPSPGFVIPLSTESMGRYQQVRPHDAWERVPYIGGLVLVHYVTREDLYARYPARMRQDADSFLRHDDFSRIQGLFDHQKCEIFAVVPAPAWHVELVVLHELAHLLDHVLDGDATGGLMLWKWLHDNAPEYCTHPEVNARLYAARLWW